MSHKFLEPIKIGNQTVKNRVMFLAMAKNISNFDDSVSAKDRLCGIGRRGRRGASCSRRNDRRPGVAFCAALAAGHL